MTLASFTTADGTKIAYKVHGNAASTDRVVLVHSLAMDHSHWQPVAEKLAAAGVCAVAVDCRGHGASDKPAAQYTIATFADDMAALMDHLGWPKAVFGGSSMGGSVSPSGVREGFADGGSPDFTGLASAHGQMYAPYSGGGLYGAPAGGGNKGNGGGTNH